MFSIWAKVMKNERIVKEFMYKSESKYDSNNFFKYLMQICKELDIETPVVLTKHYNHFEEFNVAKFIAEDFIDTIDFDYLILENVI